MLVRGALWALPRSSPQRFLARRQALLDACLSPDAAWTESAHFPMEIIGDQVPITLFPTLRVEYFRGMFDILTNRETTMPITEQELAVRLRQAREAAGLTQEDVARKLGLSRSSIAQIELGNRSVSSLELDHLARLYGRSLDELLAVEFDAEATLVAIFRAEAATAERGRST